MKTSRLALAFIVALLLCAMWVAGCTVSDTATTDQTRGGGSITGVSAVIGGVFGSTGCTMSSAGNLQCDGAATFGGNTTITGTATISATTIGGGFGSTGCTISSAGVLQCNGAATIGGATAITGALSTASTFAAADTVTLPAKLNKITAGSVVTPTDAAAFTLTATFQPLDAAADVTPTLTIPAAGVYACMYNTSAYTITLADSGNQVLSAAWSGTQYDTLCGYSDGTRFIEISRSTN